MTWYRTTEVITSSGKSNGTMLSEFMLTMDGEGDPNTNQGGWRVGTGGYTNGDIVCQFQWTDLNGTTKYTW